MEEENDGAGVGMREGMLPTRGTPEWGGGECMEKGEEGPSTQHTLRQEGV